MKHKRRRGGLLMMGGLLLIAAALALTAWNVVDERRAADDAAGALAALKAELPEPASLIAVNRAGEALSWPMDASGAPMAWPMGESGVPMACVTDEWGAQFEWAWGMDVSGWIRDTQGALLPWLRDAAGNVLAWPVSVSSEALQWMEIQSRWSELVVARLPYGEVAEEPVYVKNPDMEMPTKKVGGRYYIGVLEIPALKLELPVMDDWSYSRLRTAPCRYAGSVYNRDIVIAGHNYARHFGGLKNLVPGDAVRFTDADGNVFCYKVSAIETLGKTDVERMRSGDWDMTLFTCTYGGANRVTVRLKLS